MLASLGSSPLHTALCILQQWDQSPVQASYLCSFPRALNSACVSGRRAATPGQSTASSRPGIGFQFLPWLSFPFFSYPSSHRRIIPIPISLPPSPFLICPFEILPPVPGRGGGWRENSSRYYTKASCIPSVNPRGRPGNSIKAKGLLFYLLSFLTFSSLRQERKAGRRGALALGGGIARMVASC